MKFQLASERLEDYLIEIPPVIDFSSMAIQQEIRTIESKASSKKERAKITFEFVRDKI